MGETTPTSADSAGTPQADDARGRFARRAGLVVALLAALAAVTTGSALTARWLAGRSGALTPIPTATTTYLAPPPVELPLFRDGQRCGVGVQPGSSYSCTYADLLCPSAVAWSPDARQVAILSHCGPFHGDGNTILVYDTATGHLRATIPLDAIIARAPGIPNNCQGEPRSKSLAAHDLFWLPSGRLAVVGSVYLWTALIERTYCPLPWDALVLVDAGGAHPQLALAPERTQADGETPCGRTWDLQTASPAGASTAGSDCPLTPALGYRWADGGTLQPLTPLTSATTPPAPGPGPVGNPAGGAQFTVWQSVVVGRSHLSGTPETATATATSTGGDLYELGEPLSALSPDGRYAFVGGVRFFARLEPAGQQPPSLSELQQAGAADDPLLPVRDAALQRVLAELPPPAPDGYASATTALAWRADGAVVAALVTNLDSAGQVMNPQQAVQVLECASGSVRLSLTPLADPAHKQAFGPASLILSWAPDGSRLLLISGARGTATLWDLQGLR